jgi:hypothetical protein
LSGAVSNSALQLVPNARFELTHVYLFGRCSESDVQLIHAIWLRYRTHSTCTAVPVPISVITIFLKCEGSPAIVIRRTKVVIISVIVKVVPATRRLVNVRVVEFYNDSTSFGVFDFVRTLELCHNSNFRLEKQSRQRLSSEMVVTGESDLPLREPFLYCDAQLTLSLSRIWQKQRQNQRLVSPQKNQATWPFCPLNQSPFPEAASPHSMPLWATCPRALRPPVPSATGFRSQVQSGGAAARIENGKALL